MIPESCYPSPLKAALECAKRGVPTVPCDPRRHTVPTSLLRAAVPDVDAVRAAWASCPGTGLAMPTGSPSGLVVVSAHPADAALFDLEERHGPLPPTATVVGPGGEARYFYRWSGPALPTRRNALGTGLDVFAERGFVHLPTTGEDGLGWVQTSVLERGGIANLPPWLAGLLLPDAGLLESLDEDLGDLDLFARPDEDLFHQRLGDERTMRRFARRLGIDTPERFCCVLPGHGETRPSASIWRGENGLWSYYDHHKRGKLVIECNERRVSKRAYTLPEVYAFHTMGKEEELDAAQTFLWTVRMLVDLGLLEPGAVYLPALPKAPANAQAAWKGVQTLLRCRSLYYEEPEFPYSRRFAADWSGVGEMRARQGVEWLVNAGYLQVARKEGITPYYVAYDRSGESLYPLQEWQALGRNPASSLLCG